MKIYTRLAGGANPKFVEIEKTLAAIDQTWDAIKAGYHGWYFDTDEAMVGLVHLEGLLDVLRKNLGPAKEFKPAVPATQETKRERASKHRHISVEDDLSELEVGERAVGELVLPCKVSAIKVIGDEVVGSE